MGLPRDRGRASFFLPQSRLHRQKLDEYPLFLEANRKFWEGLTETFFAAQLALPPYASSETWQRVVRDPVDEYLRGALQEYRQKWEDRPCHQEDVRQVLLEKNREAFEKGQRDRVPVSRDVFRERLNELAGDRGGELTERDRDRLLMLFDELQTSHPIALPPNVLAEDVIFVLARAIRNQKRVRGIEAQLRGSKERRKSARRRLAKTKWEDFALPGVEHAIEGYVRTGGELRSLREFKGAYRRQTQRPRRMTKPGQYVLRRAIGDLLHLIRSKTRRPYVLIHALLDRAGLLGAIHRDPGKALEAIRKLASPIPPSA